MGEQVEPGFVIIHSDIFRKTRSDRLERYNVQINKLVIRLSKLLAPGTPIGNDKRRREFEQTVSRVEETYNYKPRRAQALNRHSEGFGKYFYECVLPCQVNISRLTVIAENVSSVLISDCSKIQRVSSKSDLI